VTVGGVRPDFEMLVRISDKMAPTWARDSPLRQNGLRADMGQTRGEPK